MSPYLSECCSQTVCVHPPAVYQQRSNAADQGEYLKTTQLHLYPTMNIILYECAKGRDVK